MSSWIDFNALAKILGYGLLAGAGLPALFAVGLRVLAPPRRDAAAGMGTDGTVTAAPVNVAVAGLCFLIVLGAIGYGIYLIVAGS
jgi:hypothetical protein